MPSLSIIVPSYQSRHLAEVLSAIVPLAALEILVVDSSPERPSVPANATLVYRSERASAAWARNAGAKKARGDFLLFLDSDVVLTEGAIGFIQAFLVAPSAELVCGLYDVGHPGDNFASRLQNHVLRYRLFDRWEGKPKVGSSSHLLISREVFEAVGGFDDTLASYEDIEFFVRARKLGHEATTVETFVGVHRKTFSSPGLLFDYARKAYEAFFVRKRRAAVFRGESANLGAAIGISWLIGALLLPLLLGCLIEPRLLVLCAAVFFAPTLMWRPVLRRAGFGFRLRTLLLWPLIGLSVASATASALLVWGASALYAKVIDGIDFVRAGYRVVVRNGFPVQVIQYVTSRCNLRCEHCFYKETLDAPDPGELSLDVLEKTMGGFGPLLWYSLAGGEPFLRKDLVDIAVRVQTLCRPKVFSFPTNGWYTDRTFEMTLAMLRRIPRGNVILFFSLDGPEALHDAIRGKGSFARVRATMARLRPLRKVFPNLYLNLVTTVQPANADCAPAFIEQAVREFQPSAVSINLFRYHSLEHPPLAPGLIDAYSRTIDAYRALADGGAVSGYSFAGGRLLRMKDLLQKNLIERVARSNEFVTPCTAGDLSYVIMEDGSLLACEILPDRLGSVVHHDVSSLVRGSPARELRRRISETNCRCTYECAMSTNTLFSWPMTRRLAVAYVRSLLGRAP